MEQQDAPSAGQEAAPTEPSQPPPAKVPTVNLVNIDELGTKHPMNSPRSLQLCNEFGVHPDELVPRPLGHFKARGVPDEVAAMRHEHYEARRRQKLALLRAERESRLTGKTPALASQNTSRTHSPSASAATEEGKTVPLSLIPRYTQDLITRLTNRPAEGKDSGRGAPLSSRSSTQPFPLSRHASAPPPDLLATTAALREERARQLIDKDNRRRLVYERALRAKEERQFQSMSRQLIQQQRSENQLRSAKTMKLCALEEQRLRREDTLTSIRMRRKQEEVIQTKAVRASVRSASVDPHRSSDRYQVQLAKALYLTPRQRSQRARSASAIRSATPTPTPRH